MIVYLHPSLQPVTPAWLDGYEPPHGASLGVCHRDTLRGHLVGIGDPMIFDCPPAETFCDLDQGWSVAAVGRVEPWQIRRDQRWARTVTVEGIAGQTWQAPVILDAEGGRSFLVAYGGRDFLPMLTLEQRRCQEVADAARASLLTEGGIEMGPAACRWAAVLLAATHHITADAIAALGLLDDRLVVEVLAAATGLNLTKETAT
ncbi:MAG: hypothetical protein H0W48_00525 [Methylibium sp.]|nr:hypothetical protein [Methylibium sp.]